MVHFVLLFRRVSSVIILIWKKFERVGLEGRALLALQAKRVSLEALHPEEDFSAEWLDRQDPKEIKDCLAGRESTAATESQAFRDPRALQDQQDTRNQVEQCVIER